MRTGFDNSTPRVFSSAWSDRPKTPTQTTFSAVTRRDLRPRYSHDKFLRKSQISRSQSAERHQRRGIGYRTCVDRTEYPMPGCGTGESSGALACRGESIRSARKDAGRTSRLYIRRLQLKTAPAVVLEIGEERKPRRIEVSGGVTRTGRTARYSPSPQPSGLRHPQAGIAGARPTGKVEKSKGNRY